MENRLKNLPKLSELLFPNNYELLPNTTELFELEFALKQFDLSGKIAKSIKGVQNTMKDEYILFLRKGTQ